jgi:hypothetical protein
MDKSNEKLNDLIRIYWAKYCETVRKRFEVEVSQALSKYVLTDFNFIHNLFCLKQNIGENSIIVRAVDRFYRRIQSLNKQIPSLDLLAEASNMALHVASLRVKFYLNFLKNQFNGSIFNYEND